MSPYQGSFSTGFAKDNSVVLFLISGNPQSVFAHFYVQSVKIDLN